MVKGPILIVSDDGDVIGTFKDLCQQSHLEYVVCPTMEIFITSCLRQKFNLAVFDLNLFSRHKLNLAEILRNSLLDLQLVIVSAEHNSNVKEIIEARLAQKVLYRLVKPFTKKEVKSVVDALIKAQGP
jgi:DNA-binding response OmpR family regulator